MDPSSSADKGKGKKRALPLDLQDIATAIQNLPGDSSALLPTPAPFAQSFLQAGAAPSGSSSSSNFASSSTSAVPMQIDSTQETLKPAQLSSLKLQQAVNRATHRNARRVRRDIVRGRYTTQNITGVVQEGTMLHQDWNKLNDEMPGKDKDQQYHELDQAWTGLNMAPIVFPHDWPGFSFNNINHGSVQILTRSLPDIHFGDSQQSRSFAACDPGVITSWTKYYKAIVSTPSGGHNADKNNFAMMPARPMQVLQPRRQRQLGEKRRMAEQQQEPTSPASKRRLISRAVSLGQLPAQNDEKNDGAVQFQHLPLPSRSSSAHAAPTTSSQEIDSQQSPQPVATSVKFDLLSSVSSCLDIVLHVCKFLDLNGILALCSVSRVFKATFDNDLEGNVMRMARQFASAETIGAFDWRLYTKVSIPLPIHVEENAQFDWSAQPPQRAPTLRYVNMLVSRERKARDIVAALARAGFRLPRTMAMSAVKKMWLLMDIPTNQGRMDMLQNEKLFTDADLLMIQMFHVKLVLLFHDPVRGPFRPPVDMLTEAGTMAIQQMPGVEVDTNGDLLVSEEGTAAAAALILHQQQQLPAEHILVETLLGQRSFEVLWKFLRRKQYRTVREALELKVRYDFVPPAALATAAGHQAGLHLNANEHDVAQILSSMATTEAASVPGVAIPRSLETLLDLGVFDLDLDASNAAGGATVDQATFNAQRTGNDNNFGDFSSSLDFNADSSFGFDQPSASTQEQKRNALDDIIQTVPAWEMGIGHLEGWGQGTQHLLRPDELAPLEAARRVRVHPDEHVDLDSHVPYMGVWGNRDFATGENILPTLGELYISDIEGNQSDARSNDDDDKENIDVTSGEHMGAVALVDKDFAEVMFPVTEFRLEEQCGNVTLHKTEWKPYHTLKSRWSTLSLQEKIDVWWENHQERLWRQSWTQRGDNDQRAISSNVNNNVDDVSYTQPDDMPNEADGEADEAYNIGSDFDEDMLDDDYDSDDELDDDDDNQSGGGRQGITSASSSQQPNFPGTSPPSTPAAPVIPLPESAQNLSRRHKGLLRSCIRWALNEQDEVDAALLAQADMEYEEEEMQHWDEFMMAAVAAGNTLFGGSIGGGDDLGMEDGDDFDSDSNDDHIPTTPVPNPEEVLAPEFGGLGDVVRLMHQVQEAVALANEAMEAACSGDPNIASMAGMRVPDLVTEAKHLKSQLAAVLQGEVFAIEV
ncbi:hypothetical protein Sste5346_000469 [Sporothrix stenoceras]|uniref:F-box domain-containing protein n=1 Tax=Sporothrix stenoceras TaxID=5173 RepID=A0ABR3ZV84_9PEZI